ncbi:hypothetical protein ABT120_45750 [Nonomuraea angiospora]|uniref:hypothetical protein n=1 Tax=Nonomuraea angiospora TaxID=46172 RepID=UPI00331DA97B
MRQLVGAFAQARRRPPQRHHDGLRPDRDPGRAPANHSSYAAFDDAVLTDGAAMYAELAARRTALPT